MIAWIEQGLRCLIGSKGVTLTKVGDELEDDESKFNDSFSILDSLAQN